MAAPAARPDSIRRHNLSLLLEHVHLDGALTRAELTQRLQVSRSTVGVLVADLIGAGLVAEAVPSGGPGVGRPSHVIAPSPDGPYVSAVDVDVHQVVTAAVALGGMVLARTCTPIDDQTRSPAEVARIVHDSVRALPALAGRSCAPFSVAVGVPGTVDRGTGHVSVAPNLDWHDENFGARLQALMPSPELHVHNDADLAVFAEHRRGGARGCDDVVFLMGRVGIGAGLIVNGKPAGGRNGHAGEIGHNVIDESGRMCHCGKRGCVETYIGESALLANAGRSGPATTETIAQFFADARSGDESALRAARAVAEPLGQTIGALVNTLNPERVLLGSFLSDLFDVVAAEVMSSFVRHSLETPRRSVQLIKAEFGADATLFGAAEVAFGSLLADPLRLMSPAAG